MAAETISHGDGGTRLARWSAAPSQEGSAHGLSVTAGFFFSFRVMFVLLAMRLLGVEGQTAAALTLTVNYVLLFVVAFAALGPAPRTLAQGTTSRVFSWVMFFLAFSGASLLWSATASLTSAVAYWCGMAADVAIVLLLLREGSPKQIVDSLMKGFVIGACAVAVIAWLLPTQDDMRLGDEGVLGPNQIGFICALAMFAAQSLFRRGEWRWKLYAVFLGITTLRSLSKTTIAAVILGEVVVVLSDRSLSRRNKIALACGSAVVFAIFWGLLTTYIVTYLNTGTGIFTLTGRIGIWAYMFTEALNQPWIGHGFHSVWKVVPPFGAFVARHAHNELLQQFYTYGAMGVLMIVGLYGSFFRQTRKLSRSPLKSLLIGLMVFVVIRGFADTEPFDLTLPLWMMTAFAAVMAEQAEAASQ